MKLYDYIALFLVLILIAGGLYAIFSDNGLIVSSEKSSGEIMVEEVLNDPKLPILRHAPEIEGITDWINSDPLNKESLKGKVVLVDFWTYSCINCIRTFPFLRAWHEKYADNDFVLLGVHTPEFNFEEVRENVVKATKDNDLTYPVAMDNDYATWKAFENQFWPAHYLIDVDGNIRYQHFGEGKYDETERAIVQLLEEGGLLEKDEMVSIAEDDISLLTRRGNSPETYLGYERISNFGSGDPDIVPDEPFDFPTPAILANNNFYFTGQWKIGPESSELTGNNGSILYKFSGREANLVMDTVTNREMLVEVLLDDQPLTEENKGDDIEIQDGRSYVNVKESRLYRLINKGEAGFGKLELKSDKPGLRGFAFTFG